VPEKKSGPNGIGNGKDGQAPKRELSLEAGKIRGGDHPNVNEKNPIFGKERRGGVVKTGDRLGNSKDWRVRIRRENEKQQKGPPTMGGGKHILEKGKGGDKVKESGKNRSLC